MYIYVPYKMSTPHRLSDIERRALDLVKTRKKHKRLIKEVNDFLRQSFGIRFPPIKTIRGDMYLYKGGSKPVEYLNEIFFLCPFFEKHVGEFTEPDGSALRIYPEYGSQAAIYSQIYQQKFNKPVQVEFFS